MLTVFDKALVAVLPGVVLFLNQKFGWHLDTSPDNLTLLATAVGGVLTYFIPNKAATP